MRQELIEHVPFHKLMDILFGKSHAMERHSPFTKLPDHINRAKFGLTPEGIQLHPVHSGKWLSYYHMLHAIDYSIQAWKIEKKRQKKVYFYKFDKSVGIVVKKNSNEEVSTFKAIVVISKKGDVVTAYPVLEEETETQLNINLKTLTFQEYNELYLTSG